MKDQYIFPITNKNKFLYTIIANLLLLVNFIFYFFVQLNLYQSPDKNRQSFLIISIVTLSIFLFRFYHVIKHRKKDFTSLHFALLASLLWAIHSQWMLSLMILLLGLFEYIINRHWYCTISSKGININSFPKKSYLWNNLENVLMKNGIFTIDQKNNTLFQLDVSNEIIPFEEAELNAFVKVHLP